MINISLFWHSEKCCFNLVMSDKIETDRIVAAAFFDDKPLNPDLKKFAKTWKKTPRLKKMVPLNTLYLHLLVCECKSLFFHLHNYVFQVLGQPIRVGKNF
jgi:hypothetical protein